MAGKAHDVIAAARAWVGVPFLHQGRTRHGVDCVGLLVCVLRDVGLVPATFERTDYGRLPNRGELAAKIAAHCCRIAAPVPGCFLAIRWHVEAAHVAIYTGETIIHAYEKRGCVVEHGYRGAWIRHTDGVWLYPGI